MIRIFLLKKHVFITVMLFLLSPVLFAQATRDTTAAGVNGFMRSNDKIYVVMAVCITILAVLFLYLIRIDGKVSKKERLS